MYVVAHIEEMYLFYSMFLLQNSDYVSHNMSTVPLQVDSTTARRNDQGWRIQCGTDHRSLCSAHPSPCQV